MPPKEIYIDETITLGAILEARLAEQQLRVTYLPLSAPGEWWARMEILLLHSYLPDENLRTMKNCMYIGIRAVRTDYVNTSLAAAMGIRVYGLKRQHGINAVAEHTVALLMGLAKNLVNADRNVKGGQWRQGLGPNWELRGKTLGIIGYGKIGRRVAEIATALGMKVLVSGRGRTEGEVSLDELLEKADVVSLHITGSEANRNFLNRERIDRIKDGAVLINTTRGLVADYGAIEAALNSGKLAAVGLDVFPEEPVTQHPLSGYPNVLCTPHTAFNTQQALAQLNEELIENLLAALSTLSPKERA